MKEVGGTCKSWIISSLEIPLRYLVFSHWQWGAIEGFQERNTHDQIMSEKDGPGNDGEHKLDMGSLEHLKKIKFDSQMQPYGFWYFKFCRDC